MNYILVCVDIFSRYAWCVPLRSKEARVTWEAFKSILSESGRKPAKIWCDEGGEFYNGIWKAGLAKMGVTQYSTHGEHKVSIVERFNRTMKRWMFRGMAGLNKHRWIEILPRILAYYNTRKHSSLGMSPTEASRKSNEARLWTFQYGAQRFDRRVPPKFQLGDLVRISRKKGVFERGFDQNWTREVFVVNGVGEDDPPVHFLKDMIGEPIVGAYYESELQKATFSWEDEFLVEKVVAHRTVKGVKESLVRWLGWPPKFDRWMRDSELRKV
jgi:hypothetical protein